MAKIILENETTTPDSEGSGKTVVYTKSDGLYTRLGDGTTSGPIGPNAGPAAGDLAGTYPNPTIASGAVGSTKLASGAVGATQLATDAVTTAKILDGNVTQSKLNVSVQNLLPTTGQKQALLGTSGTPSGSNKYVTDIDPRLSGITQLTGEVTATGPGVVAATIANGAVTSVKLNVAVSSVLPTTAEKAALAGTTGSPGVGNAYVTTTDPRMADSRAPSGSAGGDLSGSYPGPTVAQLQGRAVSASAPSIGQALAWDGTAWSPSFAPSEVRFIVGNTGSPNFDPSVAVTTGPVRYYPDSGDGTQLRAAIAAANAFPRYASVYVRPGEYRLGDGGSSTAPIVLQVPLIGAGPGRTNILTVGTGGTPYGCVFRIDSGASPRVFVQDLLIATSSVNSYAGTDKAAIEVISTSCPVEFKNVHVTFSNGTQTLPADCSSVFYVEGDVFGNTHALFDNCQITHQSTPAGKSTFRIKGASATFSRCNAKGWLTASSQDITCVSLEGLSGGSEPYVWMMCNQSNFLQYGYGVKVEATSVHTLLMSDNQINAFYGGVISLSDVCSGFSVSNNQIEVRVGFNNFPPFKGALQGIGIQNNGNVGQIVGNSVYAATGIDTLSGTGPKKGHTIGLNTINYSGTAISSIGGTDQVANNVTYL